MQNPMVNKVTWEPIRRTPARLYPSGMLRLRQRGSWPREEGPGRKYAYMDGTDSFHVVQKLLEKENDVL